VSSAPGRRSRRELLALPWHAAREAWRAQEGETRCAQKGDGRVRLDREVCLAWNGVTCASCVTPCAAGALKRDRRGRVVLDRAACTGCGDCVAPCPVGALLLL
jgi:ferredoxin